MLRRILAGIGTGVVAASLMHAQGAASQQQGGAQGGRGRGGAGSAKLPTPAQWDAMSPKAKEYVDKARALAGNDPDLQFDFGIFCKASGGSQNEDRATIGVPGSEPRLQPSGSVCPPVPEQCAA